MQAQENERRAISRELHDEVGQSLSALHWGLINLKLRFPAPGSQLDTQFRDLKNLAESSVGVVRNMTLLLRPSMLDDLGLVPALQWQCKEVFKRSGMPVEFTAEGVAEDLSYELKTAVYRVAQEALHNCEKHAQATKVRFTVRQHDETLLLSIQDDGIGFEPNMARGLGLRGMQERIENVGGLLNVDSELGRGTLILVRLPLFQQPRGNGVV